MEPVDMALQTNSIAALRNAKDIIHGNTNKRKSKNLSEPEESNGLSTQPKKKLRVRNGRKCNLYQEEKSRVGCDDVFEKFEDLPIELNVHIFSFLSPRDLCTISQSSKKWNEIVSNEKNLWMVKAKGRWPSCELKKEKTWREVYKRNVKFEERIAKSSSPGITAISIAIEEVYGIKLETASAQQAHCHSPNTNSNRRSTEPIQTISVFSNSDGPIPHWHYVTWGLSELHEKDSNNLEDVSGWGFELSFRLAKTAAEMNVDAIHAPAWPINFLQSLARYVHRTSNVFGKGDHMPLNKPLGSEGSKTALLFTTDPQLKNELKNPFGEFTFIQIVGVTEDELEAAVAWNKKSFLRLMAQHTSNPYLVTDLSRPSILSKPEMAKLLKEKTEEEGSTQGLLFVEKMRYLKEKTSDKMILEIPPMVVADVLKMLKGRIRYKRDFYLVNTITDSVVNFTPPEDSHTSSWKLDESLQLTISVSPDLAIQLRDRLKQQVGDYSFPALDNFTLRVVELTHWQNLNRE